MRDDSDAAGMVIVGFLLGLATGVVGALLFAPTSGEETRRKLGERAREGRNSLSSAVERGREAYQQARSGGSTSAPKPGETL